jgi:hypothetical protein
MRFMMKTDAMTTMMAGPRTVGLGCFSPMQWLDERSEAIIPFEDEQAPTAPPPEAPAAQTLEEIALRVLTEDETCNFRSVLAEDIAELRQQGIEVDDGNEPALENAEPRPQATGDVGEWVTPTICARRQANCTNCKGS